MLDGLFRSQNEGVGAMAKLREEVGALFPGYKSGAIAFHSSIVRVSATVSYSTSNNEKAA